MNLFRPTYINTWNMSDLKIMEHFVEYHIPDNDSLKIRLRNALTDNKPFRNFKDIIKSSQYAQAWFDFKQSQLELYVIRELR